MIATYSSLAMVSSAVIYLLAMCAYALEWAAIRRPADTAPGEEAAVSPRASRFGRIGLGLMLVAVLCHVAGVVLRGVAAQRAPWGNMYEFVTSSLGFAALFALYLIWRRGWGWTLAISRGPTSPPTSGCARWSAHFAPAARWRMARTTSPLRR